jgi:hypothetical protein
MLNLKFWNKSRLLRKHLGIIHQGRKYLSSEGAPVGDKIYSERSLRRYEVFETKDPEVVLSFLVNEVLKDEDYQREHHVFPKVFKKLHTLHCTINPNTKSHKELNLYTEIKMQIFYYLSCCGSLNHLIDLADFYFRFLNNKYDDALVHILVRINKTLESQLQSVIDFEGFRFKSASILFSLYAKSLPFTYEYKHRAQRSNFEKTAEKEFISYSNKDENEDRLNKCFTKFEELFEKMIKANCWSEKLERDIGVCCWAYTKLDMKNKSIEDFLVDSIGKNKLQYTDGATFMAARNVTHFLWFLSKKKIKTDYFHVVEEELLKYFQNTFLPFNHHDKFNGEDNCFASILYSFSVSNSGSQQFWELSLKTFSIHWSRFSFKSLATVFRAIVISQYIRQRPKLKRYLYKLDESSQFTNLMKENVAKNANKSYLISIIVSLAKLRTIDPDFFKSVYSSLDIKNTPPHMQIVLFHSFVQISLDLNLIPFLSEILRTIKLAPVHSLFILGWSLCAIEEYSPKYWEPLLNLLNEKYVKVYHKTATFSEESEKKKDKKLAPKLADGFLNEFVQILTCFGLEAENGENILKEKELTPILEEAKMNLKKMKARESKQALGLFEEEVMMILQELGYSRQSITREYFTEFYPVDFYIKQLDLILELDGSDHYYNYRVKIPLGNILILTYSF